MTSLWLNIRFSLRLLRKNPGFTSIALLALTLGIGANTAIFSVVYASLLAPLPYPNPQQLVMVWSHIQGYRVTVSTGDFLEWRRQATVFQDLTAWDGGRYSLSISGHPEVIQARITWPNFFKMQGIPLSQGRDFLPEDGQVGKDHVVIMTNHLWRERFGGDPRLVGQAIRMNGESYTVVGILAPGMLDRFESHLFVPLALTPERINHEAHPLAVMGRLKPGVTLPQANAEMSAISARLAEAYPKTDKNWTATVEPLKNNFTSGDTIKALWLLLGAVGFVLLIACVNVANLLLARGTIRQKEVAIRSALGATRRQIFSQFLTESVALALIGGALGIGLAAVLVKTVVALLPPFAIPSEADVRLNLPVLIFSLATTILAGVLCGTAPAWQTSRWSLSDTLKEGGRSGASMGRQSLRRILVVVEFALALTLLSGAGLVIHSFWKLSRVDLGFRSDHILTFSLPVPVNRFSRPEQNILFYQQLLAKIEALPGITSASVSTGAPVIGPQQGGQFSIAGKSAGDPSSRPGAGFTMVTPGYFRTLGIPLVQGRSFTEQDVAGSLPVAIVNETFVRNYLANVDPLTQRIIMDKPIPGASQPGPPVEWQIVGVYRDVHNFGVRPGGFPEINVPFAQSPWPDSYIVARTSGEPAGISSSIASVIQSMDSDLPMDQVRTMDQLVDESLAGDRFATVFFGAFAGVALVLAAIGIYGVMSFAVAQRTHEIGIRMALGAGSRQVLLLVLREGMLLALGGMVLGLGGAYLAGRAMKSILYQVGSTDPVALTGVAGVLLLSAFLACYVPARRATQVDPMVALRQE